MSNFQIDYFELMFLAEACMPPAPIARACFWDKMIDVYYAQLTWYQRRKLHEYFRRNRFFLNNLTRNDIAHFDARYNPENQYIVKYNSSEDYRDAKDRSSSIILISHCYSYNNHYHTHINRWVIPERITSVEKMDLSNDKFDDTIFQKHNEDIFPLGFDVNRPVL